MSADHPHHTQHPHLQAFERFPLPQRARQLAYAGLLPFVLGALLVWLVREDAHPFVVLSLQAYGALIVSFLGGIYWGVAFREVQPSNDLFVWGVVPALLAWPAVIMPGSAGLVILGVLLLACYAADRRIYPRHGMAHWLTLRFRLSTVASLSCFIGAAGT